MTESFPTEFNKGPNRQSSEENEVINSEDEELKELFPDPAVCYKCSRQCSQAGHRKSSSGSSENNDPAETTIIADGHKETEFSNMMGRSMITRRITIAGGFLDLALFTLNCEQLKFVLELGNFHIYYKEVLGLIITSLVLQVIVGLTMFLLGYPLIQKATEDTFTSILYHMTMGLVALITIVNIFIGTFGPKGTVMARCLGAFAYPRGSGSVWLSYLNATRNYMGDLNHVNFTEFLKNYS